MPTQVSWYVPEHVILVAGIGHISYHEIIDYSSQLYDLLQQTSSAKCHILMSFAAIESLPLNPRCYVGLKWENHPKVGWVVVAEMHSRIFSAMIDVVLKITGKTMRYECSLETALRFLQDQDPTIPR